MKASDKEKIRNLFKLGNGSKEKHDFILNVVAKQLQESGEYIWVNKNFSYPFGKDNGGGDPGEVDIIALREDDVLEIYEIKSNPNAFGRGMGQLRKANSWIKKNLKSVYERIEEKIENGEGEEKLWYNESKEKLRKHKEWFEKHNGHEDIETIVCYPIIEGKEIRLIYHEFEIE